MSGSLWRYFCHYMSLSLCHESKGDHHEAIQLSLILQCLYAFRYCTESRVFVCFKLLQILYRICSVCLHATSCSRYCTESVVFACFKLLQILYRICVCELQAAPDTVQNLCLRTSSCSRYCTESVVFACFKLLQILYRICVCMLQDVQNLQCLFACFKQPPDTVHNL